MLVLWWKLNQFVAQSLMIPLALIMGDKLRDGSAKVAFAERNQAIETFLLDRADETFSVSIGRSPALHPVMHICQQCSPSRIRSIHCTARHSSY
jgi:hypothetical protein